MELAITDAVNMWCITIIEQINRNVNEKVNSKDTFNLQWVLDVNPKRTE